MHPVNPPIRPPRSDGPRRYRSDPAVRGLSPDKRRFCHRTRGRVARFDCIGPALTHTTPVPKAVWYQTAYRLSSPPPTSSLHRPLRQHPRYWTVHRGHPVTHPCRRHLTRYTLLQCHVTSAQKSAKSPQKHKFALKLAKAMFLFVFCVTNGESSCMIFYVQSAIHVQVCCLGMFNLPPWPPWLYL